MNKQVYFPDTTNVQVKIEADSLEELFLGALQGMAKLLMGEAGKGKFSCQFIRKVSISSADLTSLLLEFLSQVLALSLEYRVVFWKLNIDQLDNISMDGCLYGRFTEGFDKHIKAITPHQEGVHQTETGAWQTVVVFQVGDKSYRNLPTNL